METLLEKLDRIAGQWLEAVDNQLQEPIVRTITGEVFTHGTSSNAASSEQSGQKVAYQPAVANPTNRLNAMDNNVVCPPLRTANAVDKR
jgi:hypothetical protein